MCVHVEFASPLPQIIPFHEKKKIIMHYVK